VYGIRDEAIGLGEQPSGGRELEEYRRLTAACAIYHPEE